MCSKLFLLAVFALVNLWWSHVEIEIPYLALFPLPISHPSPTNTGNPAPTHNWNSRFSPWFSAQIPNITAKLKAKSRILPNLLGTLKQVQYFSLRQKYVTPTGEKEPQDYKDEIDEIEISELVQFFNKRFAEFFVFAAKRELDENIFKFFEKKIRNDLVILWWVG